MVKRKAFTLIELLVVISIIALLMSIMMPSLQRAREQAKGTVCKTNLKQWGVITFLYTNDYNGSFSAGAVGSGRADQDWIQSMRGYYQDIGDMRVCPSAKKISAPDGQTTSELGYGATFVAWGVLTGDGYEGDYGSYAFNGWLHKPTSAMTGVLRSAGYPAENNWGKIDVKGASEVPMFSDGMWVDARPKLEDRIIEVEDDFLTQAWWNTINTVAINRHRGAVHSVFLDGAVDKVGLKQLWELKWHRNWDKNAEEPDWPDWIDEL